jgi:Copper chaperone
MNSENTTKEAVLETRDIAVSGITCDKCVARVEKTLRSIRGVRDVQVTREPGRATVTFDTTVTKVPELHDALLKSGYTPGDSPLR